jgi:hypothetical protein
LHRIAPSSNIRAAANKTKNGISYQTNAISRRAQAIGYSVWHLALTDKGVGPGGESRLLAGAQLAEEDNDDGVRAGCPQLGQCVAGVEGDQFPIHQQLIWPSSRGMG